MTKLVAIFIVLTSMTTVTSGQNQSSTKNINKDIKIDSLIKKTDKLDKAIQRLNEKLNEKEISDVKHSGELTINSPEKKVTLNDYAPWIATLIIGVFSYIIGRGQIKKMQEQITLGKQTLDAQKEIALTEIKKTVISENRQKWLNDLRDLVSEFIALMQLIDLTFPQVHDKKEAFTPENMERYNKMFVLETKIQLMLNLKEPKHNDLLTELRNYDFINESTLTQEQREEKHESNKKATERVVQLTQEILKEEWERIKRLD